MTTTTSADGTRIAYTRAGAGPALVLVDGAMCYRGSSPNDALAKELAAHFTVYTYDRRGRGDSGDTAPYAVEREVEDLDAVIARLQPHGAELVGSLERYGDTYRLCYLRGPAGIIIELAERAA